MNKLLKHFGFSHHPFGRNVQKKALFRHRGFDEASCRLLYCIELDAIAILIAEAGCGKSFLLGQLAEQLQTDGWNIHYFAFASATPFGLISTLARKVGIVPKRSASETANLLNHSLLTDTARHLLIIDEAHELRDETLQDIRLLTIADFDRKSPFLLLLAGQPRLDEKIAEPTHHALDQRISTVARLLPLSQTETREYITTRLDAVGAKKQPVFEDAAIDAIFDATDGVPRRINSLATSSLIITAARTRRIVSSQDVYDARVDRGRV